MPEVSVEARKAERDWGGVRLPNGIIAIEPS